MAIQSARSARLLGLAIVALAPLLVAPQVEAQISTGDLTGRVEDEQGTPLPGVTVTATSPSLQGVRVVVSDGNGNYKVPLLPAGTYRVAYELNGFAKVLRDVNIDTARTTASDPVTLRLATIEEEIVVTGQLDTISKTLTGAATIDHGEVEALPIERDLVNAALMAPGVHATPLGNEENPVITISGAMSFENLFLINGVVMNENLRGQAFDLFIEDAIEETTVADAADQLRKRRPA